MASEKRTTKRWRYRDFVVYHSKTSSGEGLLGNLSSGGIFIRTSRPPEIGELVELVLQGTTPPLSLQGKVRWSGSRRDGSAGFGAELVDPPRGYLEMVRSLAAIGSLDSGHKRVSPRVELSIPVGIELEAACDEGILCDISLGGARLEGTSIQPAPGSEVVVTFAVKGYRRPFEVLARVVRTTEDGGYAVEFEAIDPKLKAAFELVRSIVRKLPDL
jgi:hypothetical protein